MDDVDSDVQRRIVERAAAIRKAEPRPKVRAWRDVYAQARAEVEAELEHYGEGDAPPSSTMSTSDERAAAHELAWRDGPRGRRTLTRAEAERRGLP